MTDKERFYDILTVAVEDINYVIEIRNEILRQLKYDRNIYWSWGPHKLEYGEISNKNPFLQFLVNGAKFKGTVRVIYNMGTDTYIVEFYNIRKRLMKCVDEVYADTLVRIIDSYVETDY